LATVVARARLVFLLALPPRCPGGFSLPLAPAPAKGFRVFP